MPLITIQPDGSKAELVIDTGVPLKGGRNWRAFAKVFCRDPYHAQLVAESLGNRLGEAIAAARRDAYTAGYADGRTGCEPRGNFSQEL
jgi:hypothetical protein